MMKILYIITGLGQGGAERVVCDLADKMSELGHQVDIVYFYGEVITKPKSSTIQITKINLERLKDIPVFPFNLIEYIKKTQPDVIHSHMFHANIISRLSRIFIKIPRLINTAHSSNEGGSIRMLLYKITDAFSDLTTNVSEYATNQFVELKATPATRIKTVYNGVDFEKFKFDPNAIQSLRAELSLGHKVKIILAVGRFHGAKNYPNLIKAVSLLKTDLDNFVLLIAGEGELRVELEQIIVHENLSDRVILLGSRSDISRLMSACDVFVLSSDYEGLPTVLIEALGCEANIVTTNVSGASEIVADNGYIVPIQDPLAISKALYKILATNSSERNKKGRLVAQDKFDLEKVTAYWIDIYNER